MPERRSPARAARIVVAAAAAASSAGLVGSMARATRSGDDTATPATAVVRRVVVLEPAPEPEPYITLEAAPAGQEVVVITRPAAVVRRPVAVASTTPLPAPATTSSGS